MVRVLRPLLFRSRWVRRFAAPVMERPLVRALFISRPIFGIALVSGHGFGIRAFTQIHTSESTTQVARAWECCCLLNRPDTEKRSFTYCQ
jgi:hypothetical protein